MASYTKIDRIKLNPDNPRTISDERALKLQESVANFPAMLSIRGVVVDAEGMCLGGNQRWTAICSVISMPDDEFTTLVDNDPEKVRFWKPLRAKKHVPSEWIISGAALTAEEIRQFIIVDNVPFGQDDLQVLMSAFSQEELEKWGSQVILPRMDGFKPNLQPVAGYTEVSQGQINNVAKAIQDNFEQQPDLLEIKCPHCFEIFHIQKPA